MTKMDWSRGSPKGNSPGYSAQKMNRLQREMRDWCRSYGGPYQRFVYSVQQDLLKDPFKFISRKCANALYSCRLEIIEEHGPEAVEIKLKSYRQLHREKPIEYVNDDESKWAKEIEQAGEALRQSRVRMASPPKAKRPSSNKKQRADHGFTRIRPDFGPSRRPSHDLSPKMLTKSEAFFAEHPEFEPTVTVVRAYAGKNKHNRRD